MHLTRFADYQVISDEKFALTTPSDRGKTLIFRVPTHPNSWWTGNSVQKPVIFFKILPLEDSVLRILFDDFEILPPTTFEKSHTRGYWEAFSLPDGSGPIDAPVTFRLDSGRVQISDVIISYQREAESPS
ncbi:MAG: hypothetical protein GC192_21365 [Bacteroidetes bacterium]|nr:hypothetical protein [Bacteroidota bacterium]